MLHPCRSFSDRITSISANSTDAEPISGAGGEILDDDLIETIINVIGEKRWALRDIRHIYKYSAATEDGRPLKINIALAPFEHSSFNAVEASALDEGFAGSRPQQYGVAIELATIYHTHCQRIERIVLKNYDEASRL